MDLPFVNKCAKITQKFALAVQHYALNNFEFFSHSMSKKKKKNRYKTMINNAKDSYINGQLLLYRSSHVLQTKREDFYYD